jgi:hypothetical protein
MYGDRTTDARSRQPQLFSQVFSLYPPRVFAVSPKRENFRRITKAIAGHLNTRPGPQGPIRARPIGALETTGRPTSPHAWPLPHPGRPTVVPQPHGERGGVRGEVRGYRRAYACVRTRVGGRVRSEGRGGVATGLTGDGRPNLPPRGREALRRAARGLPEDGGSDGGREIRRDEPEPVCLARGVRS